MVAIRISGVRWRKCTKHIVVVVKCQTDLFEIVPALSPPCNFFAAPNRGQEECDQNRQNANNGNDLPFCEGGAVHSVFLLVGYLIHHGSPWFFRSSSF